MFSSFMFLKDVRVDEQNYLHFETKSNVIAIPS